MAQDQTDDSRTPDAAGAGGAAPLGSFIDAPAQALGDFMNQISEIMSDAARNAVYAQQQAFVTAQAATTAGVTMLYSLDTAAIGTGTEDQAKGG